MESFGALGTPEGNEKSKTELMKELGAVERLIKKLRERHGRIECVLVTRHSQDPSVKESISGVSFDKRSVQQA